MKALMDDFSWTVAETLMNARPCPAEVYLDGWILRASGGPVRRTNSVNSTPRRNENFDMIILGAETIYHRLGQASIFKVLSFDAAIDGTLAERGYRAEGLSHVLLADLDGEPPSSGITVDRDRPSAAWLEAWRTINRVETGGLTEAAFLAAIGNLVLPAAFALRRVDGEPVSLAYGVTHRGLLTLEAVGTHPDHRGRGYARDVVSSLMQWARGSGLQQACLAVEAGNAPALKLYRSLGFDRELYRYHYRRRVMA